MSQTLREQVEAHVRDAMGDFPTPHLLEWHTDIFMLVIKDQIIKELESWTGHANEIPESEIKARIKELKE